MAECAKCGKLIDEGADEPLARELELWAMNTERLYNTYLAWYKNFQRKQKKGVYSHELAVKGIRDNYARQVIQDYNKNSTQLSPVSGKTKELFAEKIVEALEADLKAGEYD